MYILMCILLSNSLIYFIKDRMLNLFSNVRF